MFLTVHGSAAILISEHTNSISLAFILGFISHFILDFLPHENPGLSKWVKKSNEIKKYFFLALADFSLLTIVTAILFFNTTFTNPHVIIAGIFGAILPDVLWGIHKATNWKFLKPYHDFHTWIHSIWEPNLEPYQMAVIQAGLLTLFIILIIITKNGFV
ncbi:hypothetical protein KKD19_03505 [Patescibacteria group bacterium]|nr:hypothetical protein [Patescibacteria group bacterium]MBU4512280.1 hypothetical protein [Patescibacteria group bacterium]MCG2693280.1 hypothetical protein [Candidatus Parcubacteria bacterium]